MLALALTAVLEKSTCMSLNARRAVIITSLLVPVSLPCRRRKNNRTRRKAARSSFFLGSILTSAVFLGGFSVFSRKFGISWFFPVGKHRNFGKILKKTAKHSSLRSDLTYVLVFRHRRRIRSDQVRQGAPLLYLTFFGADKSLIYSTSRALLSTTLHYRCS